MITTQTTLVLGAGASHPYGYPLGSELVAAILRHTEPNSRFSEVVGGGMDLNGFRRRLQNSEVGSIDEFLEANMEFSSLGKLAIAAALTVYGPAPTWSVSPQDDWYRYLWARLREGAPSSAAFRRNNLRVVTYNYENSLHLYLKRVLNSFYTDLQDNTDEYLERFVRETIPIVHLHGSLDGCDEVVAPHQTRLEYLSEAFLRRASHGLRIIHEEKPTAEYTMAHTWIEESRRVYFLGFGYHPTNCKRLDMVSRAGSSGFGRWEDLRGTTFGLGQAERIRASRAVNIPTQNLPDHGCLQFLKEVARLD